MPIDKVLSTSIANGAVTASALDTSFTFGFKNRIINGGMVIDQRNAGASVTPTADGQYTIDRWKVGLTQSSKFSVQQSSTAATGFINSLLATSLSAYSVASGDTFLLQQNIEGLNVADLGWGTANAKTVTLSFWVYSSLNGTFGGSLINSAGNRSYPFSYTISTANTWTQISLTIAGDTSGTWLTTSAVGIGVRFGLGSGATFSGTSGAWAAGNLVQPTGTVSIVGTNGATFYITGVQLEKGSTATSFDYRPYGTELALCQRYYFKVVGSTFPNASFGSGKFTSSTAVSIYAAHPVAMRDLPTWSYGGTVVAEGTGGFAISAIAAQYPSYYATRLALTVSGATAGQGALAQLSTTASDFVQATAEL